VKDLTGEAPWGKCRATGFTADPECLDEGEQTKRVLPSQRIRPMKIFAPEFTDEKVVMEVRNGSDVPGVTGKGACAQTEYVVGKIIDDDFDDLQGEPGGRRGAWRRRLRRSIRRMLVVESGFGSIPNSLGKEFDNCGGGL